MMLSMTLLAAGAAAAGWFTPPAEYANDPGSYRSPLVFEDGKPVRTKSDWRRRREEILAFWNRALGAWPAVIGRPVVEYLGKEQRDNFTQHRVRVEVAPGNRTTDGYLLVPEGKGPFPAVIVVYYEPETPIGKGKAALRDHAYGLARRGFVTLSMGTPASALKWREAERPDLQPLSMLAYTAANMYQALAGMGFVDAKRIGITGHSYGGKWSMFASCLFEKFACAAWSDPGIVFDESRPNVNYWEPWYIGFQPGEQRPRGTVTAERPRTGPYKQLFEGGRDLHELHALMAPRPFLVSGGSEDPPERWRALNHSIAVNRLLGYRDRVAMTNRPAHAPTEESNEQLYRFFEMFLKK